MVSGCLSVAGAVGVCWCRDGWRCQLTWALGASANDFAKDFPMVWKKPDVPAHSSFWPCGISFAPPETASSWTCDVFATCDFGGEAFESNVLKTLYVFIISPDGACEGRQEGEGKRGRGEEV